MIKYILCLSDNTTTCTYEKFMVVKWPSFSKYINAFDGFTYYIRPLKVFPLNFSKNYLSFIVFFKYLYAPAGLFYYDHNPF